MSEPQPRPLPDQSEYRPTREDLEKNIEDFVRDNRCGYHFWLHPEVPYTVRFYAFARRSPEGNIQPPDIRG
jgi:hypothetical protein